MLLRRACANGAGRPPRTRTTQPPEPSLPSPRRAGPAQQRNDAPLVIPPVDPAACAQPAAPATEQPAVDHQLKASVVTGDRVRLVPYCRAHVPRVHQWKQDLELLRLLESEPRTSDDEACTAGVTRGSVKRGSVDRDSALVGECSWARVRGSGLVGTSGVELAH